MQNYSQYIIESLEGVGGLKKAAKKNGIAIPATFKQENKNAKDLIYKASGGYRGEKLIKDLISKLLGSGWKKFDDIEKFTPDGSKFEFRSSLVSPDQSVIFISNTGYGGCSFDNYYYARFILTDDFESELTRADVYNAMAPVLAELGFRYVDPKYKFVDLFTFKNTGAGVKDAVKKLESWKSVGENTWEKGNYIATYNPEGLWGELTITTKQKDKIKIKF